MKKTFILCCVFVLMQTSLLMGQVISKKLPAQRTTLPVLIDGKLNDPAWKEAAKADDYTEFRPVIGRKEEQGNHTETFNGAPTLTTYNVTLTCKDASGKQSAPLGSVQTNVTW